MENTILYAEINLVCILMLALIGIKVKKSMFLQIHRNLFFLVTVFNIVFFIIDGIWVFFNNNILVSNIPINWALNLTYYILSAILGYLWFAFSESIQDSKWITTKSYRIIATAPIIILIILSLLSIKTGWMFYIDSSNIYHRGPLYFIQLLCSYGYILVTAIKGFYLSFKTVNYKRKSELRILFVFIIPTIIAGATQVFFPGFPILCIGNTLGIMYVYLTLQEQLVSIDPLTKLNNRNQLFQYLSGKIAHPNENRDMYLIIMDIDYFKTINDKYGHVEGDEALKEVASALTKACSGRHSFASRFGGDEFIVVCEIKPEDLIEDKCNAIREELKKINKPYEISLSFGYSKYFDGCKSQQELISKADAALYEAKRNRTK